MSPRATERPGRGPRGASARGERDHGVLAVLDLHRAIRPLAPAAQEFEGVAARGLEKCWKDAEEGLRRAAILWALVEIRDAKSADFLRGELASSQRFAQSYHLVQAASACFEGRENPARSELDSGLRWGMSEKKLLPDAARAERKSATFVPKGD